MHAILKYETFEILIGIVIFKIFRIFSWMWQIISWPSKPLKANTYRPLTIHKVELFL